MKKEPRPVLLLELNEIPWRVWDLYLSRPGYLNIKNFFAEADQWTTMAQDQGELSPWITWPTFHRGINNTEHGIQNLGQDPKTYRGEPIWQTYRNEGHSIGICGSLQSWPPVEPGPEGFYLPDTFAPTRACFPPSYERLQQFNLDMVRKNGRVIGKGSIKLREAIKLGLSLPFLGIRWVTLIQIIQHLLYERLRPQLRSRRPIFQTILFWDVFRKLYKAKNPPALATFFTNHVAGVMHRYWNIVFPHDFKDGENRPDADPKLMDFAMEVTDKILSDALDFQRQNPDLLIVAASSMGQSKVTYESHEGIESLLKDSDRLISELGFHPTHIQTLLAMVPQTTFCVRDNEVRQKFKVLLMSAHSMSGVKLFEVDERGATLTVTLITPPRADIEQEGFWIGTHPSSRILTWRSAGIEHIKVEAGTAYHIPEGFLAIKGAGITPSSSRREILATEIKPFILSLGEVIKAHEFSDQQLSNSEANEKERASELSRRP